MGARDAGRPSLCPDVRRTARTPALLLPTALAALAACGGPADAPGPGEYRALWEAGRPFPAFLASVEAREETWHDNFEAASVPADLLERAREAVEGVARAGAPGVAGADDPGDVGATDRSGAAERDEAAARLLVVAEDWCGDSAHTIPYLARLAGSVGALDLRIVGSDAGRSVMEAHLTPDGRSATPTVLLLDADFVERGCFVERPPDLQRWFLENPDSLPRARLLDEKYARYEADGGQATMEEIVTVLEAAARGEVRCPGPAPPADPA